MKSLICIQPLILIRTTYIRKILGTDIIVAAKLHIWDHKEPKEKNYRVYCGSCNTA